jgi:ABC-type nitrate/sulfonate/bicarbonate transport system substrate-binding protein
VPDLVGKRLALPDWPDLIMNFFRFAAQKAFVSALQLEGIAESEANFVDVVETGDHFQLLNPNFSDGSDRNLPSYYHCQMQALLNGEVDAIFAKGGEIAAMQAAAGGGLRMLTNLIDAEPMWAKVNNATPRILTVSNSLVREHPDQVITYARTLLQAAKWAQTHHQQADQAMATETGVAPADIHTYYTRDIYNKLMPQLSAKMLDTVEVLKIFLFDHGYIDNDFSTADWQARELLQEAYHQEQLPWQD